MKLSRIVCFGEMLWDILPDGKYPGGAPLNVAVHLGYLGHSPHMISSVGKDDLGRKLLTFVEEKGLDIGGIQINADVETGTVVANPGNRQEVTYEIRGPVAWDYIDKGALDRKIFKEKFALVFGSLSVRSEVSRMALLSLLEHAHLKVFDANFRTPHYSQQVVTELCSHTNILKLNHNELMEMVNWYDRYGEEKEAMRYIRDKFRLKLIVVTRGENGASVLSDAGYIEHPGFPVEVEDTIGSGDAFLATFLNGYLAEYPMESCLEQACKAGALVASYKGATPNIAQLSSNKRT